MTTEVRKGYKQTDLGIFPDEWKELKIKDISDISVGKDLVESEFSSFQDDIYKYPVFSNTVSNEGLYGFYNFSEYTKDSLTVVGRGVGLGTAFKREESYGAIGRLLVIKPIHKYDFRYLSYFINFKVNIHFESGGIPQLTGVSFGNYKVILPPTKSEQTAIAIALSDSDALIISLEKLIQKKRAIKQGAMQQLLKPKEGWEVKTLGEIGECVIGLTYRTDNVKESGLLVMRSSNIQNNALSFENNVFVDVEVSEKLTLKENDILICVRNGSRDLIGKCALIKGQAVGETFGAFMSIFRSPFNEFVFNLFQSNIIKRQIDEYLGATINQITNKSLNSFEIPFPPIAEQTRIATIFSDMDAEITGLEQKLGKYKLIKQGMMQELLTGRIRLV